MTSHSNPDLSKPKQELGGNLLGPEPTLLPADGPDSIVRSAVEDGDDPRNLAAAHPESPLVWALLANEARADGDIIAAYAFARVGYHRGLDALRRAGWKGAGPIPASHEPNHGFLNCLLELSFAAQDIGETSEVSRIHDFLEDADPTLVEGAAG